MPNPPFQLCLGWFLASACACTVLMAAPSVMAEDANTEITQRGEELDAAAFFSDLVTRYREMTGYVEDTEVEQETSDPETGDPPVRTRTRIRAEITDGRLRVERPGLLDDAVRTVVGESVGLEDGESASESDLWLLPHMALRFTDSVLQNFRAGVEQPFAPVEAELVSLNDRDLVRIELRSGDGFGIADGATFELFVDPDRMLVERVEGQQMLASGLAFRTSLKIDPLHVREPGDADSSEGKPASSQPEDRQLTTRPDKSRAG